MIGTYKVHVSEWIIQRHTGKFDIRPIVQLMGFRWDFQTQIP